MTIKGDQDELLRSVALQNATSILIARQRAEQRSEAYLAEAQRLSHTGSFGWRVSTGEILWSEETFRIFQYDRTTKPTVELILQRVHPEDAALMKQTIERASRDGKDFEHASRLVMPDGSVKYVHVVAHALSDESGSIEFVGAVMDVTKRKRADEDRERLLVREQTALGEAVAAQQRFRDLVNSVEGIVWEAHVPSFQFSFISKQAERVLGYPVGRWLSEPTFWKDHVLPEDREWALQFCQKATAEKRDHDFEYRMIAADGSVVWLRDLVSVVVEGDRVTRVRGVMIDITSRKQAEAVLREQASLLNLTHDSIFVRDMHDVITYWNRGAEALYGWTAEKALGKVSHQLTQTVFPAPLDEINTVLLRTGRWEGELVHTKVDGTQLVVASRWALQRDEQQRPIAILETNNDITERKRAEAELRESERRHRYIFQSAGVSIWEQDFSQVKIAIDDLKAGGVKDFRQYLAAHPQFVEQTIRMVKTLDVNEATVELFGAQDKQELLASLDKIFATETRQALPGILTLFEGVLIALAEGRSWFESQMSVKTLKGDPITVVFTITFPAEPAKLNSVLVTHTDITEQKRAEEALRQAQADLAHVSRVTVMGELTASLAHEVNQPIAAAVTNAKTCLRWLAGDTPNLEEARAAAMRIVKDQTRAAEIISRVRLLFKKGALQRELVDVNEVIREMIVLLHGEATRYSISVRAELAADLPQVTGDRVQLQQVLMNLMMNSIDAMKDVDGTRELAIKSQRSENEQLMVSVTDTGVGLPPQQADQIFNVFFTTKPHGTGMGLRISRSIVESHGGRLWAADNSPRGASFYLTLPTKVEAHE